MQPLADLEVLVVDCQATAAAPHGHLIELGWARAGREAVHAQARLIQLQGGERIPPAVTRITGISQRMVSCGVEGPAAWKELVAEAWSLGAQPVPAVAHFARFEQPFLRALAGGTSPLDIVCTHEIARRLLPDLPRCSLRALSGYFGRAVGTLRRSAEHVEATAYVWRELVGLLDAERITTWPALREWLNTQVRRPRPSRRIWPMPRDVRLSLPDAPGVYRLLRTSGDVLYVGKASSLRDRVNSYFRKQHGVSERALEMLSQVRAVSFEVAPSALEAALLEPDEIKRHHPPYNVALTDDREVWFTSADLSERSPRASPHCPVGPFTSGLMLQQFADLARVRRRVLGEGRWGPDAATFNAGYSRLCAAHKELSSSGPGPHSRLLRLGTRLWQEGRRDCDPSSEDPMAMDAEAPEWTPELVQFSLERLAIRAALARRRARWFTRMVDAAVVWSEPGVDGARLIVVDNGEIVRRAPVEAGTTPPVPPGHQRPVSARHDGFTLARFDRLRVLTTELKRLVSEGSPVALRFGVSPILADARLAYALSWI